MLPGSTGETCTLSNLFQSSAVSPLPRGDVLSCTLTPPLRLCLQTGWPLSTNPAQTSAELRFLLLYIQPKVTPTPASPGVGYRNLYLDRWIGTSLNLVQRCWIIIVFPDDFSLNVIVDMNMKTDEQQRSKNLISESNLLTYRHFRLEVKKPNIG